MTVTSTAAQRPVARRRAAIWITIGIIVALVILFFIFAGLYTDWLWYQQLGYLEVLTTQWFAATALFFIGFLGMALPLWLSVQLAYRLRPVYVKLTAQLDRYQQVIEPLRRLAMYGIPVIFGLFAGVSAASRWQTALLWLNRTPSGKTDPQFHLDISFYLFDLPFFHGVVGFASAAVIIALIATLATTYLYGSIRVVGRELHISRAARVQISVIAAVYLLLQAVSVWLDRFATLTDPNLDGVINGAAYTDVNATIPGRTILAGIAVVVAILFLITAVVGHWRWPLVGTALLLISALIVGSIYPWIVQRFQVDPSEKTLEQPYIKRAIAGTRDAYGLDGVEESTYNAKTTAEPGALRQDAETTANIRIIDPAEVSPAFAQLQQFKQYYGFEQTLDVDRYKIDGKEQDTVIAVRELEQSGLAGARNWYNDTLVYTHGYGIVAAYGNQRSPDGQPVFLESGIPVTGKLGKYEPRVYFGEKSPTYSIVGGSKNAKGGVELDYPAGDNGAQQTFTTFAGNAGPKLDNIFNRLVYALKFQDEQIVLSNSINVNSQILYDRNPVERVQKVAPYLTLDSDPYPAVVDGQIKWIIDGYTTSDNYPYSQVNSLSNSIADTQTPKQPYALDDVNYMRNAVKATVDAYDGKVTLYAWDTTDPILKTWEKIFPSTVKPMKDMSSQLLSHVRYPADLFKVQRAVLGQYHVTDPGSFYSQDDTWITPDDPVSPSGNTTLQPPYYLSMQMPGQDKPSFSLYSTYIPAATTASSRSVLKGYLAVDADAGSKPGTIASGYGKLRLLTLPSDDNVPGPGQVQNTFGSDPNVSQQLNVLRLGKTDVISGNLLTLPVGGGLLYVQPVYVKSTGETSYPLLQKVLVAFGDKIAFEDTLDKALDVLFGGDSGASAGDTNVTAPGGSTTPPATGETPGSGTTTPSNNAALQQALNDAKQAMLARDAAMKAGDWAAYGKADAQLTQALDAALAAEGDSSSSSK